MTGYEMITLFCGRRRASECTRFNHNTDNWLDLPYLRSISMFLSQQISHWRDDFWLLCSQSKCWRIDKIWVFVCVCVACEQSQNHINNFETFIRIWIEIMNACWLLNTEYFWMFPEALMAIYINEWINKFMIVYYYQSSDVNTDFSIIWTEIHKFLFRI